MLTLEVSWSHELLEMCGFDKASHPTLKQVLSLIAPESQTAARSAFETLLHGEDVVRVDLRATNEAGRSMWLRVTAEALRWNGAVSRMRGAVQDITELRLAQFEAERAAAELAWFVGEASDAVFSVSREGRFLSVNTAAEQLLYRRRSDLVGRLAYEEYPRLAGSRYHAHFLRVVLEHRSSTFETYAIELGKWIRVTMWPTTRGVTAVVQVRRQY